MARFTAFWILMALGHFALAHPSWGLVRAQDGSLYFADILHNGRGSVYELATDGELKLWLSDFHAHNVSLDENGYLISAHGEEHHTMIRLYPDGSTDTLISKNNHREFFGGNCLYTPEGDIIFGTDGYLWLINSDGEAEKFSDHKLDWNQSIMALESGYVYAPDIGNGKGELWQFTPQGEATLYATDLITKFKDRPYDRHNDVLLGMGADEKGNIYIAELAGQRIIKISEEGKSDYYVSPGKWFPTAMEFYEKQCFILEYQDDSEDPGPRIISLAEDGSSSILFDFATCGKSKKREGSVDTKPSDKSKFWPYFLGGVTGLVFVFLLIRGIKKR